MRKISEALDPYTGICKEAIVDSAAKLGKSFEKVIIEILLLYMVVPGKINFTQLGRYGRHCEQCYRQNFGRRRSKSINWLRFNISLALRLYFDPQTFEEKMSINDKNLSIPLPVLFEDYSLTII